MMEEKFHSIAKEMIEENPKINTGNMMRSPALTYGDKVFAFFYKDQMVFKLGDHTPLHMEEYPGSTFLDPFKNKPPLKGWLVVPSEYQPHWKSLTEKAYQVIRLTKA